MVALRLLLLLLVLFGPTVAQPENTTVNSPSSDSVAVNGQSSELGGSSDPSPAADTASPPSSGLEVSLAPNECRGDPAVDIPTSCKIIVGDFVFKAVDQAKFDQMKGSHFDNIEEIRGVLRIEDCKTKEMIFESLINIKSPEKAAIVVKGSPKLETIWAKGLTSITTQSGSEQVDADESASQELLVKLNDLMAKSGSKCSKCAAAAKKGVASTSTQPPTTTTSEAVSAAMIIVIVVVLLAVAMIAGVVGFMIYYTRQQKKKKALSEAEKKDKKRKKKKEKDESGSHDIAGTPKTGKNTKSTESVE